MDGGKIYGIGYSAYTMGLVYNKNIFTRPASTRTSRRRRGRTVATAAKTISAKVPGVAGYSEYSAGNTGGWHFTASLYSRGSSPVSADGKKANVNTPEAKAVLANLKAMRFTDNSVGTTQLQTVAGPADQRRRRQGRHVHRCARLDDRDREHVQGQVQRLGDGPDAR
jgi:ABC-type glycerol-3-phosphate transport system substrate-binding protein